MSQHIFDAVRYLGHFILLSWMSYQLASLATKNILRALCKEFSPKNKWVVVVGSACSFDRSLVKKLTNDLGLQVFFTSKSYGLQGELHKEQLKEDVKNKDSLVFIEVDMESEDSLQLSIDEIKHKLRQRNGQLHGLICHETTSVLSRIDWQNFDKDFKESLDIDICGLMNLLRKCLPILRKDKGRIILLTSDSEKPIQPYNTTTAVINASINSMIEAIRREVMYFGIDVINVRPDCLIQQLFARQDDLSRLNDSFHATTSEPSDKYDYKEELNKMKQHIERQENIAEAEYQTLSSRGEKQDLYDTVIDTIGQALTDPYPEYTYLVSANRSNAINWLFSTVIPNDIRLRILSLYYRMKGNLTH